MEREDPSARMSSRGQARPADLFTNPLNFIAEVHMREREICAMIDTIATNDVPNEADCAAVAAFLRCQLPRHLEDEELDLFPMMLARCDPEDDIGPVIEKLLHDHGHAAVDTPEILLVLDDGAAIKTGFDDVARAMFLAFASHSRRHLILENAIILPIARARLTAKDLKLMRQHMLERRGLDVLLARFAPPH
jgi:hemerythrin-like domain-containing protein